MDIIKEQIEDSLGGGEKSERQGDQEKAEGPGLSKGAQFKTGAESGGGDEVRGGEWGAGADGKGREEGRCVG